MTTEELKKLQSEMPDKELIGIVRNTISELARTGGQSHKMCIPPQITDTDMILSELTDRFERLITEKIDIKYPDWFESVIDEAKGIYKGGHSLDCVKFIYDTAKQKEHPIQLKYAKYLLDTFIK